MRNRFLQQRLRELRRSMPETPIIRLPHDELDLYAKLEYGNPNGSSKDRSAYWILKRAIERGELAEHGTVVESSSGNFAISLATFCDALGLEFVPVLDPNVNASTEAYLRARCRRVEKVTLRDASGGYLGSRLDAVDRLRTELDAYWPNQYANTDALLGHYRLTGAELCRALAPIDYLFVGVSTGGTISGLSRRVKEMYPNVTVVAVDAEGSAIFGGPPRARLLPGLGSSIQPPLVGHALVDEVATVPERAAIQGCHELLNTYGLHTGGSTGSVYAAITRYFSTEPATIRGHKPVVAFLCADRGLAYTETIYDPLWVAKMIGDDQRKVEVHPAELPDAGATRCVGAPPVRAIEELR